jgi:hypothetical protein
MFKKMFFAAALVISAAMLAPQGLSAQKGEGNVVKVQGHVHELLTKYAHEGKRPSERVGTPVGSVYNIDPTTVKCWIGCTAIDTPYTIVSIDTAYLLVKWTDGKAALRGDNDSILIWGYQWVSEYIHPVYGNIAVTKYSIDMLRAVANRDCRFSVLLQNTGGGNFILGGIGYNFKDEERVPLVFDFDGAIALAKSDTIKFKYEGTPKCEAPYNQFVTPGATASEDLTAAAIDNAENTGVIKHPLDATYGYPAYDYDFWKLNPDDTVYQWQAGWNYNYWAFYTGNASSSPISYTFASNGIATELLGNNDVNYFIFASMNYLIPVTLDGDYSNPICCVASYCAGCNKR